jgi:hypothetical protein
VTTGIAGLPDFRESLRRLLEEEQYSLTDVGLMFNVTRERMRQLAVRYDLRPPEHFTSGLLATRVWDDTKNRFHPVTNKVLRQRAKVERVIARRNATKQRRWERRVEIAITILALRRRLCRTPSLYEVAVALKPDIKYASAGAWLCGHWCPETNWRKHRMDYAKQIREMYAAAELEPRGPGGAGHI